MKTSAKVVVILSCVLVLGLGIFVFFKFFFIFSVEDERVARQIENSSSRQIKLHWKRYLGVLPWRGNSQYVVDSVVSIQPLGLPNVNDDSWDVPEVF